LPLGPALSSGAAPDVQPLRGAREPACAAARARRGDPTAGGRDQPRMVRGAVARGRLARGAVLPRLPARPARAAVSPRTPAPGRRRRSRARAVGGGVRADPPAQGRRPARARDVLPRPAVRLDALRNRLDPRLDDQPRMFQYPGARARAHGVTVTAFPTIEPR